MSNIFGNVVGGPGVPKTFIIEGEDGTEIIGTVVGSETLLTATANDIRKGKVAATDDGIIEGTKDIPSYRTFKELYGVFPGEMCSIPLSQYDLYDYTKLQCIIAPFNTTLEDSVAANKVVINDYVYNVNSVDVLATVTKNAITKSIDLNIVNDTEDDLIIHYFTYKEEG